jgi:hypothetical protein
VHAVVGRLLSVSEGDSRFGSEREAEVALGENFPLFSFGSGPVTMGVGTEVYGRFSLDDPRTALISNDWVVGLNVTADLGRWAITGELSHESSHLGDEYEDRFDERRVDWSREIATLWVSYTARHWRFTGSGSQVLIDGLGLPRRGAAFGIDYRGSGVSAIGATARAIVGLYSEANAATAWRVSTSARAGVALSSPGQRREISLSLIGHDGLSTQRQFFRRSSRYVGLELRFDL